MITFSKLGSFGRLGNQLFQISAAVGLALRHNTEAKFYPWKYSILFKNQINQTLKSEDIKNRYKEAHFHYSKIPYYDGLDISGYFQSYKYFEDCASEIRKLFIFNIDAAADVKDFCSIHVRRTDYLAASKYHTVLGLDYYNYAMKYMKNRGIDKFLVFSDDMSWCKENIIGHNIFYSDNTDEIADLALMSKCGHNIIANSSFSWWGAWLNNNENKTVIAPERWFGPANNNCNTNDLYCTDWVRL